MKVLQIVTVSDNGKNIKQITLNLQKSKAKYYINQFDILRHDNH